MEDINIGELKRNLLKNVRLMFDEDVLSKDDESKFLEQLLNREISYGIT